MQDNDTSTYFSFPASLEANLVYQSATLKAMETSSKTASCWALGPQRGTRTTLKQSHQLRYSMLLRLGMEGLPTIDPYLGVFPCKVSVHLKFWIYLILLSCVVPSKDTMKPDGSRNTLQQGWVCPQMIHLARQLTFVCLTMLQIVKWTKWSIRPATNWGTLFVAANVTILGTKIHGSSDDLIDSGAHTL